MVGPRYGQHPSHGHEALLDHGLVFVELQDGLVKPKQLDGLDNLEVGIASWRDKQTVPVRDGLSERVILSNLDFTADQEATVLYVEHLAHPFGHQCAVGLEMHHHLVCDLD